jgi:hypothetical protein
MLRAMLWPRRVWWVTLDRSGRTASTLTRDTLTEHTPVEKSWGGECVSCGAPTTDEQCSTCAAAQARHASAALVLGAAGVLFGVAAAFGFPLLWPRAPLLGHVFAACFAALLPVLGLASTSRRRALWGSPPRVWRLADVGGIVERGELAARLASGRRARSLWLPPIVYRVHWWPLPALAALCALLAHGWQHPRLWVINLTAEPLQLLVDGQFEAALAPAGLDVARAVVVLRLPRGEHSFATRTADGRVVTTVNGRLESGKDHLYAPASAERCFWLELTGYGRDVGHALQPLTSRERFFVIDAEVDAWFAESPAPPASDRRSSGGTLTSLRQSPCPLAPESVRRAASAIGP